MIPTAICKLLLKSLLFVSLLFFYIRNAVMVDYVFSYLNGYNGIFQVWYDERYKLVRTDYRPMIAAPPTYNTNPLTEIQDFNGGLTSLVSKIIYTTAHFSAIGGHTKSCIFKNITATDMIKSLFLHQLLRKNSNIVELCRICLIHQTEVYY